MKQSFLTRRQFVQSGVLAAGAAAAHRAVGYSDVNTDARWMEIDSGGQPCADATFRITLGVKDTAARFTKLE